LSIKLKTEINRKQQILKVMKTIKRSFVLSLFDLLVNETIDTQISGSGRVYYVGSVIHTSISGSGKVVNKNE